MQPTTFSEFVNIIIDITNTAVPVIISLTLFYFLWRVIDAWIINGGDEKKVEEGKQTIVVGFVVIFLMLALWSVVGFFRTSLFG